MDHYCSPPSKNQRKSVHYSLDNALVRRKQHSMLQLLRPYPPRFTVTTGLRTGICLPYPSTSLQLGCYRSKGSWQLPGKVPPPHEPGNISAACVRSDPKFLGPSSHQIKAAAKTLQRPTATVHIALRNRTAPSLGHRPPKSLHSLTLPNSPPSVTS